MLMKICPGCEEAKEATLENFHSDKRNKDGLFGLCKKCVTKRNKIRYKKNKELILQQNKEYRTKNKEKLAKYDKERKPKNKEKIKEYNKEYRQRPALYDTYAHQLEWCEKVKRNGKFLEVICTKCKIWFIPTNTCVSMRIYAINGNTTGNSEYRFYCSEECKNTCEIYHKKPDDLMRDDAIKAGRIPWHNVDRELQRELREIVLERDNYTCQECGSTDNPECHHIKPVATEPIESADVDNCITLCEKCHKKKPKPKEVCY